MFTPNEKLIIGYLQRNAKGDLAELAKQCEIARSSTHAALQHLVQIGVVASDKESGRTVYRMVDKDALERAAQELMSTFKSVVMPVERRNHKLRLAFTDNYFLLEEQLGILSKLYDIRRFEPVEGSVPDELLFERSRDAEVIVRFDFGVIDREFLKNSPDLRAIVCPTCFPLNVDLSACMDFNVKLWHPDPISQKYYASAQIEYAVNATFILLNPIHLNSGIEPFDWSRKLGNDLYGKNIALVTANFTVRPLVEIFRAFGCQVRVANTESSPGIPSAFGLTSYDDQEELWEWADVFIALDGAKTNLNEYLQKSECPKNIIVMSSLVDLNMDYVEDRLEHHDLQGLIMDMVPPSWNLDDPRTYARVNALLDRPNVYLTQELGILTELSLQRSQTQVVEALMLLASQPI